MATLWTASPDTQRSLWPLLEELSLAVVRRSDSQGTGFPGTVLMAEGVPCSSAPAFPGRGHAGPSLPRLPCTLGEAREEAAGAQFAQGTGGEGGYSNRTWQHSRALAGILSWHWGALAGRA